MSETERIHMQSENGVRCKVYRGKNLSTTSKWSDVTCRDCLRHAPARGEMDPKKRILEYDPEKMAAGFCYYAAKVCRDPGQVQSDLADLLDEAYALGQKGGPWQTVYVVLTKPGPHQEFVECETADGDGVRVGMQKRADGCWVLGPFLHEVTDEC